jgi:hypothetical protein
MGLNLKSSVIILAVLFILGFQGVCQTPGYFNYQAIIRDSGNRLLINQAVAMRFSILEGSETGQAVFVERHNITSNAQGYINLFVGSGNLVSGDFNDIAWADHVYFLKVELDPDNGSNYTVMGTSQLVSVPYAMHAGDVDMPLNKLEVQEASGQLRDEALFEVKREDGSTVFAVYNEGIRMYVDDSNQEGVKGGFAVGGYNATSKGYTNEYLRVTADSVRIYIDEPVGKGVKGGFAVGGYRKNKGDAVQYLQLDPQNYFIGHEAGILNTAGLFNSFFGYQAGRSNTIGNQNILLGYQAGFSNEDGSDNLFFGDYAGFSNRSGNNNVFIGTSAGEKTTSFDNVFIGLRSGKYNEEGNQNVMIGVESGLNSVNGHRNVFIGTYAGSENKAGNDNVFMGTGAGFSNDSGTNNIFIGSASGYDNKGGWKNVFVGEKAGMGNVDGKNNILIGYQAGYNNKDGLNNVFIGQDAGMKSESTQMNVFIGGRAGYENISGQTNVFLGQGAGQNHISGNDNVYMGFATGYYSNDGSRNTYIGSKSGLSNGPGTDNVAVGYMAGISNKNGNGNVFLGSYAGYNSLASNRLYIENSDVDSSEALIYGEFDTKILRFNGKVGVGVIPTQRIDVDGSARFRGVGSDASANDLRITEDGTLTTSTSDARLKTNLLSLENALSKVLQMHAYSFNWKSDTRGKRDVGFMAQDMEAIFPEAVFENRTDGYLGINYSRLSVLLVEAMKEQQQIIDARDAEIIELNARLDRLEMMMGVQGGR